MDHASEPERHFSIVELELGRPRPGATARGHALAALTEPLRALGKDPSVEQAVELGRLVIEHLYGGDLGRWRDRGPKLHSLRGLVDHAGVTVSSSALYRSIALYELSERLGGVERWTAAGLGVSHLRLVLGLTHEDQRRLLDLAAERRWTVAELEREAAAARQRGSGQTRRGGRPRTPRFARTIARLAKLAAASEEMFGDLDAVDEMDAERVQQLRDTLVFVRNQCADLTNRLDPRPPSNRR